MTLATVFDPCPLPAYEPPARRRRLSSWADDLRPLRLARPPSRLPGEEEIALRIRAASLAYKQARYGITNNLDTID